MDDQLVLFDRRFLESYAGNRLLGDARAALIELIANCWDAGARRVDIDWPEHTGPGLIRISDNGHGMTEEDFRRRWMTLAYDRVQDQGLYAEFPPGVDLPRRPAFGRNGQGRFAAFCFGNTYVVHTWRDGQEVTFDVRKGTDAPLSIRKSSSEPRDGSGTEIELTCESMPLSRQKVRAEIGMRFLTDPNFEVYVSGEKIRFDDLPEGYLHTEGIVVDALGTAYVTVIDIHDTDRTSRQHGIAWHVQGRLVGECSWRYFHDQAFIDGRRTAAKRYTFIIRADFLVDSVRSDWSGFKSEDLTFEAANERTSEWIRQYLLDATADKRKETFDDISATHQSTLRKMGPLSRSKWSRFVQAVQAECISISEKDVAQLAGILARLEISHSKYGLLGKLHEMDALQLHELYKLLEDWTVDMAKIVLDELKTRMLLLDELQKKVMDTNTQEVQELQPIFERGLWIFGPEFETIEFTSNRGMTTVIQDIFGSAQKGSRNRPDFVILPDSTVGLYSYPLYDEDGAESGVLISTLN